MIKNYVLDTNVLIQSPQALNCFEDNNIILPLAVLEELDSLKNADGERGANVRQVIRCLENLRLKGNLLEGVTLPSDGLLRLELNYKSVEIHPSFTSEKNDDRILRMCLGLKSDGIKPILVTKDIVIRLKAQALDIDSEDFITERVSPETDQYTGRLEVYAADEHFSGLKKKGIPLESLYIQDESGEHQPINLFENQFVTVHSELSNKKTILARVNGSLAVPLKFLDERPFSVKARNAGQRFLQEALMKSADKIPLVIIKGTAGTAKTFYSLAVGLHFMIESKEKPYRRILITRPNTQFDDEIGYLPGSELEKIAPLMRPIIDNLEILVDRDEKQRYENESELRDKVDELFKRGYIAAEAMNFIRGRSITQTYLIIDEAQNLTPRQAKGIITRAGKGTKIIMLGDINQIDHPLLDDRTNGLSYASEKMKGSPLCCQITMLAEECERSELAFDAAVRMGIR